MADRIEGRAEELLKAKNFCHVSTLRGDGSVHTAPVWVDVQDGKPVLNTAEGRAWPKNLERDPRVTLTIQNLENPYEYLEIRGRVAERTHEGADEHIGSDAGILGEDCGPGGLNALRFVMEFRRPHAFDGCLGLGGLSLGLRDLGAGGLGLRLGLVDLGDGLLFGGGGLIEGGLGSGQVHGGRGAGFDEFAGAVGGGLGVGLGFIRRGGAVVLVASGQHGGSDDTDSDRLLQHNELLRMKN